MAHIARTGLLRQTFAAAHFKALFAPLASPTFRPLAQPSLRSVAVRDALQGRSRVAAFHATPARAILAAEPQKISGTVNDPAPVPETSPAHGSYHWTFERTMAAGLIPLTFAPFVAGVYNPLMDSILVAGILIHSHIGFESIIIDYIPTKRMPGIRKLFMWGLKLATVLVGVGFYEFETNDVGLTQAIKRIWTA